MAEILGIGMTHAPHLQFTDENMANVLRRLLKSERTPAAMKDPQNWPAGMRAEWGGDEGLAAARKHRAALLEGVRAARAALDAFKPDCVLIWGDDQYENFREDVIPPFCIYALDEVDYAPFKASDGLGAHMGRTPMTTIGSDYRSGSADEAQVMRDAEALEAAGAFSLLLTGITPDVAERVTQKAKIPTIAGFGAGDRCDGQIGVTHGVVGFTLEELERPRAAYGPVAVSLFEAAERFTADVRAGKPVRSRQDQSAK